MAAERHTAYVGLGSNLGEPATRVRRALVGLGRLPGTTLDAVSSLYRTRAWGVEDQPDFINAVARLGTTLSPRDLLASLQALEHESGRRRTGERWGPRVLDLDILMIDDLVQGDEDLTLPHPRMHERAFVLVPLLEIAPDIEIPGRGPAAGILEDVDRKGVRALEEAV